MSVASITKPQATELEREKARFHAMTEEERHAAAMADPDARPMTEEELARAKRVPVTRTMRRALKLTEEEFASQYKIPIEMLRDWEAGKTQPDAPARAYLRVIAKMPDEVRAALVRPPVIP